MPKVTFDETVVIGGRVYFAGEAHVSEQDQVAMEQAKRAAADEAKDEKDTRRKR
ncbi:MAG: hypothetical protein IRY83_13255 [Chloroflexi bacterium]|nr:hypothetical protein [Chloroflexota bacterium]